MNDAKDKRCEKNAYTRNQTLAIMMCYKRMHTMAVMFSVDLCNKRYLPVHHVFVDNDRFFTQVRNSL